MKKNILFEYNLINKKYISILFIVISLTIISLSHITDVIGQNNSDNISSLINKGAALGSLGNYTEAIPYFDKALKIDPNDTNALCNLNNTLYITGKILESKRYSEKAKQLLLPFDCKTILFKFINPSPSTVSSKP